MDDAFHEQRGHLRAVAHRMLGSLSEADDAVQEAWVRLDRAETGDVRDLRAWLTTVVARVCLDMLRARAARREVPLDQPVTVASAAGVDPEREALLVDSVGLALLVVLETLSPAERLAFVLHDTFAVPFDEIAEILGRSPAAAKMLASRARRRVRATGATGGDADRATGATGGDADRATAREATRVVEAFLAAARNGDFAALLDVLDPDVTARADAFAAPDAALRRLRGADAVARQALAFSHRTEHARVGLVDGEPALLVAPHGHLVTVMTFTIGGGRILAIDIVADPHRLAQLTSG